MPTRSEVLRSAAVTLASVGVPITTAIEDVGANDPSPPEHEVGFLLMMPNGVVPAYNVGDVVRYGHGADASMMKFQVTEVNLDSIRVVRYW